PGPGRYWSASRRHDTGPRPASPPGPAKPPTTPTPIYLRQGGFPCSLSGLSPVRFLLREYGKPRGPATSAPAAREGTSVGAQRPRGLTSQGPTLGQNPADRRDVRR